MLKYFSKFISLLFLYHILLVQIQAQNINLISGVVLDSKEGKLVGSVIVLNNVDSTFVKGESFYDGDFSVDGLNDSRYIIKISSLGFEDQFLDIVYNDKSNINLGEIILNQAVYELEGVEVKAKAPEIVQRSDGTIEVKVENTILENSASASEILSNAPNVLSNGESFSLFGRGEVIMYLNGRRIDNNQLSMIAPEQIKKIEIISNPSAKYDAQGMGVINIITKSGGQNGYNVMLRPVLTYSDFGGALSQNGISVNSVLNKFSIIGTYMFRFGTTRHLYGATRDREAPDFFSSDLTENRNYDIKHLSNYSLGLGYNIGEKSNMSVEYRGRFQNINGSIGSNNLILNDAGSNTYGSDIGLDEKEYNNSISLNYNLSIDTLGSSIFLGGQYSTYNAKVNNLIAENNTEGIPNRTFFNIHDRSIDIVSVRGDYVKGFKNKAALEMGVKYSSVKDDSYLNFESYYTGEGTPPLGGDAEYWESVPAAYVNLKGKMKNKNISYQLGLRTEYTNYELKSNNENDSFDLGDHYINFFPNLSLNFSIKEKDNLNLAFTSRINRPPYNFLNPNPLYQDRFTQREGNPNLIPEKIWAFEIGYKTSILNAKVSYSYVQDPLEAGALQGDGPNEYTLKRFNLQEKHLFLASVSKNFNFKGFSSSNTVSMKYSDWRDNEFGFEPIEPRPHIYLHTSNSYTIMEGFTIGATAWYLGRNYGGLYHWYPRGNVAFFIKKSFFNKALNCSLTFNDIFGTTNFSGEYAIGNTDITFDNTFNYKYGRLIVSYKFGKLKKTQYKNKATGQSENDRIQ